MRQSADELAPPDGVEERVQLARIVDAIGVDLRQIRTLDGRGAGLQLPDDCELLTRRVILDADQRDEVLASRREVRRDVRGKLGADDVGDDPPPAADQRELPGLGRATHRCLKIDGHGACNLSGGKSGS